LYILVENFEKELCNGSTYPRFKPSELLSLQIPVPKSPEKIKEWVKKISKPYDEKNTKQTKIKELEKQVQNKIKNITDNEDCEEIELSKCCEIKYGTRITKKDCEVGNIPVYGGGDITFYTNKSNRNSNTLVVSRFAQSGVCVRLIFNEFYLNDSGLSLHSFDKKHQDYINYFLLCKEQQMKIHKEYTTGSIQCNLMMDKFKNFKIPIPKDKELIKQLEPTFNEIEKLQKEVKEADKLFNKYIEKLRNEAILPDKKEEVKDEKPKKIKKKKILEKVKI